MTKYMLREGSGAEKHIDAATLDDARAQAREWVSKGDYPDATSTVWMGCRILEDGCLVGIVTVAVDPIAPKCEDGRRDSHDWQEPHALVGGIEDNPGVWGHGGGVTIRSVCMRCGTRRLRDTWAQNPETGEQGLESVSYDAYVARDEVRRLAEEANA